MFFIFHNVVIVFFSTKRTVALVSVDVVKVNTINFNFPSPHSEPREVVELNSTYITMKVMFILIFDAN